MVFRINFNQTYIIIEHDMQMKFLLSLIIIFYQINMKFNNTLKKLGKTLTFQQLAKRL